MLVASRNGIGCARCALRRRLLALQQSRQKHHSHPESTKIRYPGRLNARDFDTSHPNQPPWHFTNSRRPVRRELDFPEVLARALLAVKEEVKDAPLLHQLRAEADNRSKAEGFRKVWRRFIATVTPSAFQDNASVEDLQKAYMTSGENGLETRLKYAFYGHLTNSRFSASDIKNQQEFADLRYPSEWFPATRVINRTIHLHVGPTNSGKTYHALQKLEQAETGVYAGPLRLLAHEVYSRLNAKGKRCALITGEEKRLPPETSNSSGDSISLASCTVEMLPTNKTLDVAVIDEIQMISSRDRGWAWTQAVLGVKAKEVHLCGEERTIPLIKALCASVGDKLEIHQYKRLSPLEMAKESLNGDLKSLRKGDCIVSFSVMGIHALRKQIEMKTGRKVATVYGSLPPETRAQQARLFNDPDNDYDFLVASDAIGMGLNLAIKRIIFESSSKFDGAQRRTLSIADIKQIGGRAGRFRTALQAEQSVTSQQDLATAKGEASDILKSPPSTPDETTGLVTTLEFFDFAVVQNAMASEPEPILTAGLFPPNSVVERYASYFPPGTPFSYILTRLHEVSQMHPRFHLCGLKDAVWVADLIECVPNLTITDRNAICAMPASRGDKILWAKLLPAYGRSVGDQIPTSIADIEALPIEVLDMPMSPTKEYLRDLERLHKGVVGYLWLSYRFAGIFNTRPLAFHLKGIVEERIEQVLQSFSFSEQQRRRIAKAREEQLLKEMSLRQEGQAAAEQEKSTQDESEDVNSAHVGRDEGVGVSLEENYAADHRHLPEQLSGETPELQYEGSSISEVLESREAPPRNEQETSVTLGGGRFSGEEDISFEDPDMLDEVTRGKQGPVKGDEEAQIGSETENMEREISNDAVEEEPPRNQAAAGG